ncbi:S8 family serine peptidase [Litoribacter ruber]|uniref:S8 family peptidase n=1 Tax=Litoribacter ruber TaxID=702568 RepID=UPI001BD984A8|nr:S8 family serine peptidase [Litoribacter ruber]MBT0810039.1 S8 family serine peptidase [Litoribacter ruber]
MKNFKNTKFLPLVALLSFLLVGCNSDLMQVDPVQESLMDEEALMSQFNLKELTEMTDFANLREGDFTGRYLIIARNSNLPNNLNQRIKDAGGEIVKTFPEIGVAVAVGRSEDFFLKANRINGIESVTPDIILKYTEEPEISDFDMALEGSGSSINSSGNAFNYADAIFDGFQWAPSSIDAPQAWDAGITGEGVRVAVIDGGFHSSHIDLAPNLDMNSSTSTVPGFQFNQDTGTFWHGTHVAGIVAASGFGIVGIAPKATIIGVKSLHSGSGAFEWILEGILYAATPLSQGGGGAQIINMSLGASINYRDNWQEPGFRDFFRELQKIYDRATRYANQNGVTVIASAGNGATNHDVAKELFKLPAQNQFVLSISSTGPRGWVLGSTNFSDPAYYSDFGKSLVDFAAPGGTAGFAIVDGDFSPCTLIGTTRSSTQTCAVFDQVFSTIRGSTDGNYGWAQGTSMASPAAAGVVALMMEANGGHMTPAQVNARLRQSSTDLGKPGNDEFYGHGFVNAAKATGVN